MLARRTALQPQNKVRAMSVLIVDDEYYIRDVLIAFLLDAGYNATGARDGRDALDCLRKYPGRFRLILLDVMMPYMTGWELLEAIRNDSALAHLPVILMTAAENVHQKALEQGAADYLPKPIDLDELLDIVEYYYVGDQREA
jgi:DNA-binding response OmpR family regulator